MKPPMRQTVTIYNPSDETDRNDNPIMEEPFETIARVQRKNKSTYSPDGSSYETTLEIDIPPDVVVGYQTQIEFTDSMGITSKGPVRGLEESMNLAGNRVFFRTVQVE